MLDVHAPHKKLRGLSEVLIHLLTITLGLLIATQIEAVVEWRHHVHLASEARAALRAEIAHNLDDMKDARKDLKVWRAQVDSDLQAMRKIQESPKDPSGHKASIAVNFGATALDDTAWRTAQTTGALAYMPYDEAQRYTEIYEAQSQFARQDAPEADVASLLGMIERFGWREKKRITAEQAAEVAGKLGEMKVHFALGDGLLQECIELNSAFLENRKPLRDFTANVGDKGATGNDGKTKGRPTPAKN